MTLGRGAWPAMIWIGGGQGAGKSTVARRLSREYDLPLHPIDLWAYDHAERMPAGQSLEDELAAGAVRAAEAFRAGSRRRLRLVLGDVAARELGEVPAIVEGPQLTPEMAEQLPAGHGVWLVPQPERTRAVRKQRLAVVPAPAAGERLHRLLERDALLAAWTRRTAQELGWPWIDVPAVADWGSIQTTIQRFLAGALREAPRLPPPRLGEQRRLENAVAARQGRLWQEAVGLRDAPLYAFACECGRSRCQATWTATPEQYQRQAAAGPVRIPEHSECHRSLP